MSTIQKSTSGVRLEQCSVFARQNLYARDSRTTALPRSFSDLRFGWSFPKVRIAANGSVVYENIGKNSSLKHYKVRARFPNGYRYFGAIISGRALCNEASPRSIVFRELVQWTSRAKDILTEHENRVCFFFLFSVKYYRFRTERRIRSFYNDVRVFMRMCVFVYAL